MRASLGFLGAVLACACGASGREAAAPPATPARVEPVAPPPGADPDRVLGPTATFGDVVRTALGADLMPAISGASEAPTELDARLQEGGRVAALTAFGVHGVASAQNALEAWTAVAPERLSQAFALIALTDEGVYVRREPPADGAGSAAAAGGGPQSLDTFAHALAAQPGAEAPATCYVTAEPEVALDALAVLLSRLPASCQAVLGTLLPAATRLPAPPTASEPPRCPQGLPELPAIAVEGSLPVAALREGFLSIAPGARRCLRYAAAHASAGISVQLALRIDPRGLVERVCVLHASVANVPFESCVLEAARNARFEPPSPAGYVEVHAPLSLVAERWPLQQAYCE